MIQQLYAQVEAESLEHAVSDLCRIYEVSRSGYYKWLRRKGTLNSFEQRQNELDYLVADIHAHEPSLGYRMIADRLLMETGRSISDLSVYRSMKRLKIQGYVFRKKRPDQPGNEHEKLPNLLNRDFHAEQPMQKLVTDVTYIKHHGRFYYLACFIDLYNREVVDWELSDTFDNFLIIRPAQRILEKAKSTGRPVLLLHSDQGIQYSSAGYTSLLKEYSVVQSMSRAGTPRDNAVMESFFARFKIVLRSHFRYWLRDDLSAVIAQTIYYFNYVRPMRFLGKKPPVPFRLEQTA